MSPLSQLLLPYSNRVKLSVQQLESGLKSSTTPKTQLLGRKLTASKVSDPLPPWCSIWMGSGRRVVIQRIKTILNEGKTFFDQYLESVKNFILCRTKEFLKWNLLRLKKLEETYTNYGCYCWIDGIDQGVIGGGATKDATDHHCKELYRCYKCVNVDYMKNYTDVSYTGTDSFWELQLKCQKHKNLNWDCDLGQRFSS